MKALTDKQKVRLAQLEQPDGSITPDAVVTDAKNPESPLHSEFEWDDSKAAHKHRLQQAREILRVRFLVTTHTEIIAIPYYVRDGSAPAKEQRYMSTMTLRNHPESARETTRQELARAEGALLRAKSVATALGTTDMVEDLLNRLQLLKLAVQPAPDVQDNGGDGAEQSH